MLTQIYNGKVLIPGDRWVNNGSVLIKDSEIVEVYGHSRIVEGVDRSFNAGGGYILPGGIDIHVHGGGGRDFMEATEEAFVTAVEAHRRHGTTSMFPTLSSSPFELIKAAAQVCSRLVDDPYSGVLGLHLEGPYFSPKMAGAQMPEVIRIPSPMEYVALVEEFPCIRRWDAAPELPGADDFARFITSRGVVAALGHTEAQYNDVVKAYESGYTLATHFYNAMTTSGIHVPPIMIKLVHKFKGIGRMCLITDALACSASNSTTAFDPRVIIDGGVCKLRDGSAIAGSIATMDRLIKTAVKEAGLPIEDVARMVSETPALIMGVYDRKGSICKHKDADIIVMDKDLNLTHVFAMGRAVNLG